MRRTPRGQLDRDPPSAALLLLLQRHRAAPSPAAGEAALENTASPGKSREGCSRLFTGFSLCDRALRHLLRSPAGGTRGAAARASRRCPGSGFAGGGGRRGPAGGGGGGTERQPGRPAGTPPPKQPTSADAYKPTCARPAAGGALVRDARLRVSPRERRSSTGANAAGRAGPGPADAAGSWQEPQPGTPCLERDQKPRAVPLTGGRCFPGDTLASLASKRTDLRASHFTSHLRSPARNGGAKQRYVLKRSFPPSLSFEPQPPAAGVGRCVGAARRATSSKEPAHPGISGRPRGLPHCAPASHLKGTCSAHRLPALLSTCLSPGHTSRKR